MNASFVQENKRALIMLAVAVGVAVLLGVYMLFTGGSAAPQTGPVDKQAPVTEAVEAQVTDDATNVRVTAVAAGSNDPFAPLPGSEQSDSTGTTTRSSSTSSSSNTSSSASSKARFTDTGTASSTATSPNRSTGTSTPASKSKSSDDPVPVKPQLVGGERDAGGKESGVEVKLVTVSPDTAVVKIDGNRTTLPLMVEEAGVTYVSPLGGGCAWLTGGDSAVRVSLCEGETTSL